MSEFMQPISFNNLIEWAIEEYRTKGSIFGIKQEKFYKNESGTYLKTVFGDELSSPVGPAAGPQSQLAQNLISAYLSGARYMEIKTVQEIDGQDIQKTIGRPCINAQDECYNCEWSTELTVPQAFDEYVKGYIAIQVLAKELGISDKKDFAYNMSVGYNLEGIKSKKIDTYIESLKDASNTDVFKDSISYLKDNLDLFENVTEEDIDNISANVCNAITLSTMHGCPAEEIELIAEYLITEKKLDTFVKCNPTMLGYDYARKTLDDLGFDYISFTDHHFKNDLQYDDGIAMFRRLLDLAKQEGKVFGLKLTNTFPVDVKRGELPSGEMYMSGRSLLPLTISLANKLTKEFDGELPMSYSGGADGLNIVELLQCGLQPITVATTILKPGGYNRFYQLATATEPYLTSEYKGINVEHLNKYTQKVLSERQTHKLYREKVESRKTDSQLGLIDCYKAPCKDGGCPIGQQIPEYLKLVQEERYDEAIEVIANDNTAPTILGAICAHHCQDYCTRVDYEKTVQIRDMKLIAADKAQDNYISKLEETELKSDKKVLVIGAGPVGIAAATYLRRNGLEVDVHEKLSKPYGLVSHVIPEFRISDESIDRDYQIAVKTGVNFYFNSEVTDSIEDLKKKYDYIVAATGAWEKGRSPVKEGSENITDALEFLWKARMEDGTDKLGKRVAVVGAGDVAMDCARQAQMLEGVEEVVLVYRRTEAYMPATQEEVDALREYNIPIMELTAPLSYDGKVLHCEKTELGEFDESGRRSVHGKGEFIDLEFDTVIGATGAQVDTSAFEANGINMDERGRIKVLATNESNLKDVYVIGDCKSGPSTIVKGMGDAKKVALDILEKENLENDFERFEVPEDESIVYAKRGNLMEVIEGKDEGCRCLKCDQVCEICTEVCPNRANVAISVDGYDNPRQIVHIDGMCNECGNCGTFCPHSGNPYKDKITLYWTKEDFEDSTNVGYLQTSQDKYLVRMENGNVIEHKLGDGKISRDLETVLNTLLEDYPYYFKETVM